LDVKRDLDVFEGAPTLAAKEAAYERFVSDNLKRNYLANYLHGMLGSTGFRLFAAPTFLPTYLHTISGSSTVVGLALALQQLGGVFTPIVGATRLEHRAQLMPSAIWLGGIARLAMLGMALAGWFLSGQPLVIAMLALIFLFGLFMGVQRVVLQLILAKVIPIRRRGRLQAWRNATGGLIVAGLAYLAGKYLVGPDLFGHGYSLTFLAAFLLTAAGMSALALLLREPIPPTVRPKARIFERLRDFPAFLRRDRSFAMFLGVQMLAAASRIALPFYVIFVGRSTPLTGGQIGLLSLAYLGAETLGNLASGYGGDKSGFRRVLLVSLALWAAGTVLLMNAHGMGMAVLAFAAIGAARSGHTMATQTLVLEFGSREELAMRLGVSSTAENFIACLAPLAGGLLADQFGFQLVFGASLGFLLSALLVLAVAVKEPRQPAVA
jgi:MFS family permease